MAGIEFRSIRADRVREGDVIANQGVCDGVEVLPDGRVCVSNGPGWSRTTDPDRATVVGRSDWPAADDDIAEELRDWAASCDRLDRCPDEGRTLRAAADEIDRLRAELARSIPKVTSL